MQLAFMSAYCIYL